MSSTCQAVACHTTGCDIKGHVIAPTEVLTMTATQKSRHAAQICTLIANLVIHTSWAAMSYPRTYFSLQSIHFSKSPPRPHAKSRSLSFPPANVCSRPRLTLLWNLFTSAASPAPRCFSAWKTVLASTGLRHKLSGVQCATTQQQTTVTKWNVPVRDLPFCWHACYTMQCSWH